MARPPEKPNTFAKLYVPDHLDERQREFILFCLLGSLGVAASYLSVNIPHTQVFIEGRWAFGFMAFALLRRRISVLLLACLLSITGFHKLPLSICFLGNMLYAVPALVTIRFLHERVFTRLEVPIIYGFSWMLLMLICYQIYNTPALWAFMAGLRGTPIMASVFSGWREQPFLIESILAGIVSAAGMVSLRSYEALYSSRRELSITLDSIGDGVITTDKLGRVTRLNPVAIDLTGWSLEEAFGRPLHEVFRIFDTRTMEPAGNPVDRIIREGVVVGLGNHTALVAKDGTKHQISDSGAPIFESDGHLIGAIMVFRDVTQEYETRSLLQKKDAMLRKAQTLAHIGSWEYESDADKLIWADETYRIFGLSPHEFEATYEAFLNCVHPDDRRAVDEAFSGSIRQGKNNYEIEHRIIRKDNKDIRIVKEQCKHERVASGKYVGSIGTIQDITERKLAEKALQSSEEKYRQLFNMGTDAIFLVENNTGRILEVNHAAAVIYGYTREELLQMPNIRLLTESTAGTESWREGTSLSVMKHRKKDGKIIPVEITTTNFKWRDHDVHIAAVRDITSRMAFENEKLELERHLQYVQKMEAIGNLAGGIAHDFNNILSPILIHAELGMMKVSRENPVHQNFQGIYQAAERARELVKQILAFARKGEEKRIPVKTSLIIKEVVQFLRSTIPSTIKIQYDCMVKKDIVRADPTQLNRIVMNLCTNAAHAMREKGGLLNITLTDAYLDTSDIKISEDLNPGHYLKLSVKDTGCGIHPEIIEKIFEPYFTTKRPGEGTGLGLAVIHGIIKECGGKITVESELEKGSAFHVLLPVREEEVSPTADFQTEIPKGDERILLVDDEKAAVDVMQAMLKELGYKVTARTSSIEALEAFRNKPDVFDLVITDQTMPNMTGKQLARELQAVRLNIPIILCTGFSEQMDEKIAQNIGIRAFVMKPIIMKEIAQTIRTVLENK